MAVTEQLDRRIGWHRLPRPLGVVTLIGLRNRLRENNLHDTRTTASGSREPRPAPPVSTAARTVDGSYTDLDDPAMGRVGCRFGRNVPLAEASPEVEPRLMEPSPRVVSRELLTRDEFVPVRSLNLLAAAWIQFEVHDWFSHGPNERANPWRVPVGAGDPWPEHPMLVGRTRPDPTRTPADASLPPTFTTDDSHWWDGSQIYGSTAESAALVREGVGGRLRMQDNLSVLDRPDNIDLGGARGNLWVGLAALHSLFTQEHNAIAAALEREYPSYTDNEIFDKARLINAALMAKIHTVEWTPAIIAHPTTQWAMNINWWGLTGERFSRSFGRVSTSEVVSGIPGSPKNHHGVPYSLTEEFVAVYRMHPLIPDDYTFWSATTGDELAQFSFPDLGLLSTGQRVEELGLANVFYSFGLSHPGAITLHNFPRHLQHFDRPGENSTIDLAAIDILRNRERGVPRYNRFRQLLHLRPAATFEQLTDNPEWAVQLRDVYGGDVDGVDAMVGMYAERPPPGFGFSDTAFRIFVLMASRRLKSDRFFTDDYNADTYTELGMDWLLDNTMGTVLLRHYPD
ncbi:MAG: peroxidase, partial [Actinomycetota bacterium]|nr:peroxidase [Actinomycetota bacterium]